jgi:glycosyltransferase involved in cell wall biosynthesis
MYLSFIIPVYNGEQTVQPLFERIKKACKTYNYKFEVVFVWDCGPDKSWEKIMELKTKFPSEVKAIRLSRNFGQHNAIICGFANAQGDFMVTMDEDLQHNPDQVNLLVEKQKVGDYDVVYGYSPELKHNGFRNLTSRVLKKLLEFGMPDLNKDYSAYRIIKRNIAFATCEMQNSYTFLDGYLSWITTNIGSVQISHNIRQAGESSYTLNKLIKHSINIFVTFSDLPLKMVTYSSFIFLTFSIIFSGLTLYKKIMLKVIVPGYSSTIILISLGFGLILFALGIIGEYIHRINQKTTKRPNYKVHTNL